jgi:ribose transport system substrate-binding protein
MNLTRRAASLALAGLFLTSCRQKPKVRILGVVAKGRSHLFWQSVHAGAIKAARERGVEISWNAPASEADIATQVQIVDSFIARRVDAIVLAPIDQTALAAPVERAAKAGIPVVIFDSDVSSQAYTAYVATNNYQGGVLAARRMGELLNGRGQISIVAVQPGAASTMARESGFQDTIRKDFPGIQIVDLRCALRPLPQFRKGRRARLLPAD